MKRSILAAAIASVALGLGVAEAQAGSDFRRGFEEEAGRIVAHHLAAVPHAVVQAHLAVPVPRVTLSWGVPYYWTQPRRAHHHGPRCGHPGRAHRDYRARDRGRHGHPVHRDHRRSRYRH